MNKEKAGRKNKPDLLRMRYEALYGKTEGEKLAAKDRRSTHIVIVLLCFAFAGAVALVLSGYFSKSSDVKTDRSGRIISIERPAEGDGARSIDVEVRAMNGDAAVERDKQLFVEERGSGDKDDDEGIMAAESEPDKLTRRIDTAVRSVNEDTGAKIVYLPSKLDDGTVLIWKKKNKNSLPMVMLAFICAFCAVYMGRYSKIKKEIRHLQMNLLMKKLQKKMIRMIIHYLKKKTKKKRKLILYIIRSKINYPKFKKRMQE